MSNQLTFPDDFIDKIICGDCLDIMKQMPAGCVDLVVTSPPYDNLRGYHGYLLNIPAMITELWRIIKPGGVIVWIVADATVDGSETGASFRQALTFMDAGFRLHDTMIWNKNSSRYPSACRYYSSFEYMFVFSKGQPKAIHLIADSPNITAEQRLARRRAVRLHDGSMHPNSAWRRDRHRKCNAYGVRRNIWTCPPSTSQRDKLALRHPASFPDKLCGDHIYTWSNKGDIVFDPMCGSGTTCKMAEHLERRWIGIDISEEYCAIARERIRTEQAQLKLDIGTQDNTEQPAEQTLY